jgi:peroxiredoxin
MDMVVVVIRLVLAAVFAVAGAAKLVDRRAFHRALGEFGLPRVLTGPLGVAVPLVELAVAAGLLLPGVAWAAAVAAVGLLLAFMAVIARSLARGETPDCNCFGRMSGGQVGRKTLVRNGLLTVAAAVVVGAGPARSAASAVGWIGALSAPQQVGLGGAAVIGVLLTSQGWLVLQLMRQNGRLLDRMAALEARLPAGAALPLLPAPGGSNGHGHHAPLGLPNGAPAPEVRLPDLDGTEVDLAAYRGRLAVLLFWSPTCGFCQRMLPSLRSWVAARPADAPALLVVTRGSAEDNRELDVDTPVLLDADGSIARAYAANGTPQAVLVGPDGRVAAPLARGADAVLKLLENRLTMAGSNA